MAKNSNGNKSKKIKKISVFKSENFRIKLFLIVASSLFILVLLRLFQLQIVLGDTFRNESYSIRKDESVIVAQRGNIYDAYGMELAIDTSVYSLWIDPSYLRSKLESLNMTKEEAAAVIGAKLNLEKEYVLRKIELNSGFVWLKKEVSFEEVQGIKDLKITGMYFKEEDARYYPDHNVGGNLLGFVNTSGEGVAGIEATYNDILRGQDGYITGEKDGQNNYIPDTVKILKEEIPGQSIYLTIDQKAQYIVDRELNNIKSQLKPTSATIMVMETKTGAIIASGNTNSYDPNEYSTTDSNLFSTLEFQSVYEPGSPMKVVTSSAGVNEGVVNENSTFYDNGYRDVDDQRVKCLIYPNAHGGETLVEGLANSCNPVFVDVALQLKKKNENLWFDYLDKFGFGKLSDINFIGESSGIMPYGDSDIYHATSAIGQGIAVTPIQMLVAASAVANDGQKMKPYLIKEIRDINGQLLQKNEPTIEGQLISKETAEVVQMMMKEVVDSGTGTSFQLENNIPSMGKTGTAEKVDETTGTYFKGRYTISFVGVAPYDDPKYTVLVIVDNAQKGGESSATVAPYYKAVMEGILSQNSVSNQANIAASTNKLIIPNFVGQKVEEAARIAQKAGIKVEIKGNGYVVDQSAKPFSIINADEILVLQGEEKVLAENQTVVPGLENLRLTDVIYLCEKAGLKLETQGTGKVIQQNLNPGDIVAKNSLLVVRLGD